MRDRHFERRACSTTRLRDAHTKTSVDVRWGSRDPVLRLRFGVFVVGSSSENRRKLVRKFAKNIQISTQNSPTPDLKRFRTLESASCSPGDAFERAPKGPRDAPRTSVDATERPKTSCAAPRKSTGKLQGRPGGTTSGTLSPKRIQNVAFERLVSRKPQFFQCLLPVCAILLRAA